MNPNRISSDALRADSVLDVSDWSRDYNDHRAPLWWGILGLIAIETTTVGAFLVSYFYLGTQEGLTPPGRRVPWPPPGTGLPPLLYPSLDLLLLAVCGVAMYLGGKHMRKGDTRGYVWTVVATTAAGLGVLWLRWLQFHAFPFSWKDSAYGSIVWTITGLHFLHVASAVIGTVVLGFAAGMGYYTKERRLGVKVDTLYWYFVVLIWVPIYLVLYWSPRL